MNYRFAAVDVDGTLLDSSKQLSDYTRATIQQAVAKGAVFCISTGRPVQAADRFTKLLGIEDMPFILYNGAMVAVGPEHRIIFEQGLSAEDARTLISLGTELGTTLIAWSKNRLYVSEFNERIEDYRKITPAEPILITDPDALTKQGITKMIWYDDLARMPLLKEALDQHPINRRVNYFTSNPLFMELVDKKCSKALAMEQLIAHLGIRREETIAIGDGFNDVPMLQYAGLGIAMGNAPDEVKAIADAVTASNDEDGVAKALIRYFNLNP